MIALTYTVDLPPNTILSIDNLDSIGKDIGFSKIAQTVRQDTLEVFAEDESASVQVCDSQLVGENSLTLAGNNVQHCPKSPVVLSRNLRDLLQLSQQALHVSISFASHSARPS